MRRLLTMVILLALASQVVLVLASDGHREIERIEVKGNTETIYYTDGSKEVEVGISAGVGISEGVSVGTAHVIDVPSPPVEPPSWIRDLLSLLKQIRDVLFGGVAGGVLALGIWKAIKRKREGRPPDYYKLPLTGK